MNSLISLYRSIMALPSPEDMFSQQSCADRRQLAIDTAAFHADEEFRRLAAHKEVLRTRTSLEDAEIAAILATEKINALRKELKILEDRAARLGAPRFLEGNY